MVLITTLLCVAGLVITGIGLVVQSYYAWETYNLFKKRYAELQYYAAQQAIKPCVITNRYGISTLYCRETKQQELSFDWHEYHFEYSKKEILGVKHVDISQSFFLTLRHHHWTPMKYVENITIGTTPFLKWEDDIFWDLEHLRILVIRDCYATTLANNTFRGAPNIYRLDLGSNSIAHIAVDAFSGLSQLYQLDLSNNQIGQLYEGTFDETGNLTLLRLDRNVLFSLGSRLFFNIFPLPQDNSPTKATLNLSHNIIQHITNDTFDLEHAFFYVLDMNENPIPCDMLKFIPKNVTRAYRRPDSTCHKIGQITRAILFTAAVRLRDTPNYNVFGGNYGKNPSLLRPGFTFRSGTGEDVGEPVADSPFHNASVTRNLIIALVVGACILFAVIHNNIKRSKKSAEGRVSKTISQSRPTSSMGLPAGNSTPRSTTIIVDTAPRGSPHQSKQARRSSTRKSRSTITPI